MNGEPPTVNGEPITVNFTHDTDGNLTADDKWLYTWNAENRLVAMETAPAAIALGAPQQRLEFSYDYQGRRTSKKVLAWNSASGLWGPASDSRFLYDGWNLLAEVGTSGSLVRSYTWGLDLSGSMQGAGGVGGLLAFTTYPLNLTPYTCFPTYDGNGNIAQYLDSTGTIAAHFEYGPFGEAIRATGTYASAATFRFSTKYTDSETGLCYYGLRYYNSSTGRWPSRDPMGESESPNLYVIVGNDTVNHYDLNGLYGESGHFYTTYLVARAAGFSDERARRMAYYSQYPDEDKNFEAINSGSIEVQKYFHDLTGGDPTKLRNYLACLIKSDELNDSEKGILIHALGDAYAHTYDSVLESYGSPKNRQYRRVSIPERLYSPGYGHLFDGHMPDYIASNPSNYGKYVDQLYGVLSGMNGGAPTNPEWISGLKDAANALPKPGVSDFFGEPANGQLDKEIDKLKSLPGGYNGNYKPEHGFNVDEDVGDRSVPFDKQTLIGKIKNGVKGCCPN